MYAEPGKGAIHGAKDLRHGDVYLRLGCRIYVSSFIGHSLDVLELDVPIIVVHHDYFPFCSALYLTFSGVCHSCTRRELEECSRKNPLSALFRSNGPEYLLSMRTRYMSLLGRTNVQHVAPSVSVVQNLRRVDSRFEKLSFHVIEHGLATAERRNLFWRRRSGTTPSSRHPWQVESTERPR